MKVKPILLTFPEAETTIMAAAFILVMNGAHASAHKQIHKYNNIKYYCPLVKYLQ